MGLCFCLRTRSATFDQTGVPLADLHLTPHYPTRSALEDLLHLVAPGSDDYISEKYAFEIGLVLDKWSQTLRSGDLAPIKQSLEPEVAASSLVPIKETRLRTGVIETRRREFPDAPALGADRFLENLRAWIGRDARVQTAEFEITRPSSRSQEDRSPSNSLSATTSSPQAPTVRAKSDRAPGLRVGARGKARTPSAAGDWDDSRLAPKRLALRTGPSFSM